MLPKTPSVVYTRAQYSTGYLERSTLPLATATPQSDNRKQVVSYRQRKGESKALKKPYKLLKTNAISKNNLKKGLLRSGYCSEVDTPEV